MGKLRCFLKRSWATVSRKRDDSELAQELDTHLEMMTEERIRAGVAPSEARREARLRLGAVESVKENCRDARRLPWMEDLWHDLRYSFRTLRERPGFTIVALLTLGLGTGATTLMFTLINSVLLKSLPYRDAERLVVIHCRTKQFDDTFGITPFDYTDFRDQAKSFDGIAAWTFRGGTITQPGSAGYADARGVSSNLFDTLGMQLKLGRPFLKEEDRLGGKPVAILSERVWRERFGADPQAIGRTIVFEGQPYTVVGVAPAGLDLGGPVDFLLPYAQDNTPRMRNRDAYVAQVFARLAKTRTIAQGDTELAAIGAQMAKQYPKNNAGRSYHLDSLRQDIVGNVRPTLLLLLGAVSAVLLIACVNIAGLMLARAVSRDRELAMRMALGAKGSRLVRQCITESSLLGLAGGSLGVIAALLGTRPFVLLWPSGLPRAEEVQLDWHVLLFALAISIFCGLLFGLAPAWRAPSRELEQTLRAGSRSVGGASRRLHSGFVVTQIALAIVLLITAGALGRTMLRLMSTDPGFNPANVLIARVSVPGTGQAPAAETRAMWRDYLARARALPGVRAAALSDMIPMRNGTNVLTYWTTPSPPPVNQQPSALAETASEDYLTTMGIQLLRGRFFDDRDRLNSPPVVVIDEVMAQHAFHDENPVGKYLWIGALGRDPVQVVGLARHVRHWGLSEYEGQPMRDQFYYPLAQVPDNLMSFFSTIMSISVRTSVPPLSEVETLRHIGQGTGAGQVLYQINTMENLVNASVARQRFLMVLFGAFAALALLLACVGIYGVLAYITSQRVPEIGVRMAMGANAKDVIRMVLRQSLAMITAGALIGIGGAIEVGRILSQLVAGMQKIDTVTISLMTAVLFVAALGASFVPALRASRVDPMTALRQE